MWSRAICFARLGISLRRPHLPHELQQGYARHIWTWVRRADQNISARFTGSAESFHALIFVPPFTDFSKDPDIALDERRGPAGK